MTIVGAGIAGSTLAFALAQEGAAVTLLEQGQIGATGASAVPLALLNPHRGRSGRASADDRAGLNAFWRLVDQLEQLGLDSGAQRSGLLRIASSRRQASSWRKLDGVRWLEPADVPPGYHAPFGGFLVERGGWVVPRRLLAALAEAVRRYGGTVRQSCRVTAIEATARGWRLDTDCGSLSTRRLVLCSGAFDPPLPPGVAVPRLERLAGDVITLDLAHERDLVLPYPLAGAVYGAQVGPMLRVGGSHRPAQAPDDVGEADLVGLRRAFGWMVPAARNAAVVDVWSGVRARRQPASPDARPDLRPLVLELTPGLWYYGALGGRGFLSSAELSNKLARTLVRDR